MPDLTVALTVTLVLSLLAGVVVVLTRLRLRASHPGLTLALHTLLGGVGLVLWLLFLLSDTDADWRSLVGVLGLGCWWVVAICGLVILVRWKPSRARGKRAARVATAADSWSRTPWLSLWGHVGLFLGVAWFTFAYVTSQV
ncbi:hypothetical protein [Nocardioides sp. Kera G14]|uniref:hypothetical protein n=1 Tax=Nocardioides sp. Kera G14 TaxID=2884264 RepID=UPI001D11758D|nr:hypothetical protein [Nocardioides sp. Kera G14]UDY22834.1 hypothetical protein LH076_12245 [Nocardioides sp. Kera G14]